ncbi:MAG: TonB-dependent receptor family protein [Polyangiales bacterium]
MRATRDRSAAGLAAGFLALALAVAFAPAAQAQQGEELPEDAFELDAEEVEQLEAEERERQEQDESAETEDEGASAEAGEGDEPALPEDEDLYELREVEVSYEQQDLFDVGGSAQVVDEEALDRQERDDIHDVILQVPGVYARQEDGFGLRPNIGIRGANAERSKKVTLMEDGILLGPAPYSAPAAYYFPMTTRIVGVEVFKGPSAIMYGPQTVGGAVNLVSRDLPYPGQPELGLDFGLGMFEYNKAHAYGGASSDHAGILLEGVHLANDGFKNFDGGGNTGFSKQEIMLRAGANTDPEAHIFHRFEVKLGYSRETSNETYLGLTDEDFRQTPYRRYAASQRAQMDWWRTQAVLSHTMQVGEDFDLVTSAYRHDFDRSWDKLNGFGEFCDPQQEDCSDRTAPPLRSILSSPEGVRAVYYQVLTGESDSTGDSQRLRLGTNARRYVSQGIQSVARYRHEGPEGWKHQLEAGVRFHYDEIERRHTEDGFLMRDAELVPDGRRTVLTTRNEGTSYALAAHLIYGVTWKGLTLRPGLRTEVIWNGFVDRAARSSSQTHQHVVLPGIGAHYAITERFGVLAGVHQGFSPLAPGQSDDVEPEKSINYELGVRMLDETTQVEAIGFFNDYSNLLGQCAFSAGCPPERVDEQINGGAVSIYGLELLASHSVDVTDDLQLPFFLTYTYTHSKFLSDIMANPVFGDPQQGDELPNVPRHQAAARVGIEESDRWGAFASATYVGKTREAAGKGDCSASWLRVCGDSSELTDDYLLVDLVGQYYVVPGEALFYLKLENILNTNALVSRRPFGARPTAPFKVMGGFEYELR